MVFVRKLKTKSGTYFVKVKNIRENGKVLQKHLGVVGRMVGRKKLMYGQVQNSEITDVSIIGSVLVLKEIVRQLELEELLNRYTNSRGKWIMALVLAHCTKPSSLNRMKKWCKQYGISDILNLHPELCKKDRFCEALDELNAKAMMHIEKELFERIRRFVRKTALFYDVTSTYFYGTNCKIAKTGHNPQGIKLPQINIGLAVTKPYGFPIFHQVYDGNIQDARSIDQALTSLKDFGIKQTTLVWDRGITSKKALLRSKSIKLEIIAGLPLKGKLKQEAIKKREGIAVLNNRIKLSTQTLYAKGFISEVYGHKGKVVVCSNEKGRATLKEIRYDEIEEAIRRWKKGLEVKEQIKKYIKNGKVDKKAVTKAEQTDGLYTLFSTNPSLSTGEVVRTYFEKDVIEKAFKCLKGMIKIRPIRHWLSDRVKAHVFICYLSYALFSVLRWKLKSAGLKLSVSSVMDLLEDLYRVRIHDPETGNTFVKHSVMSKEQESILKAVSENIMKDVV